MQKRLDRRFVPWLIFHGFEFWYYYVGATICLYLLHHFQSAIPALAKSLGDLVGEGKLSELNLLDFLFLAVAILFFRTLSRLLFFYPARVQQKFLRMELMEKLEETHPKAYGDVTEGDLFQTIFNDINRLRGLVGFGLLQIGNIIIAAFIFIPKIKEFNPDFVIAFSPVVVCVLIFTSIIYIFQPYMKKDMDMMGVLQNFIIESYDAKKTIKNFHSEKAFLNLFKDHSYKELKYFFISGVGKVVGIPFIRIGVGASLLWAAYIVKVQNLGGTSLIFFSGFLFLILEPLMFLSWLGIVASQGFAGWVRIKELWDKVDQKVDFSDVAKSQGPHFNSNFWEKEIQFNIKAKEWTVLIGETGSGKSYLLEKIADSLSVQKTSYSLIQQEPYLYNDTIENNIFLGLEKTQAQTDIVKKYIRIFGLDQLQGTVESVLKMEVGENGKKLSGGQQKRLALIRSLISNVDYILWDDPFSSVDFILEKQILEVLLKDKTLGDKTFVITSHRLSTVKYCDHIIYVSKNGIEEEGTVSDLLGKVSKSSEYFKKQLV